MSRRGTAWCIVASLAAAGALAPLAACSKTSATRNVDGLEIVVSASGLAAQDFDDVRLRITEQSPSAQAIWSEDYAVPQTPLPSQFTLFAGSSPAEVLITVTAFAGGPDGTPVVQRVALVQVPTDRVAVLHMVLAEDCVGQVEAATGAEGEPTSTCPANESCQPSTGTCGSNTIDANTLPTYVSGESLDAAPDGSVLIELPPADASSGEAQAPDSGSPDATVSEGGPETDGGGAGLDAAESGPTCDTGNDSNGVCCPVGQTGCGGTCVDLQTSNATCGACGLTCATSCALGECTITLGSGPAPIGNLIASDGTNVYWAWDGQGGAGGIVWAALNGTGSVGTAMTDETTGLATGFVSAMTSVGTTVYASVNFPSSSTWKFCKFDVATGDVADVTSADVVTQSPSQLVANATTFFWVGMTSESDGGESYEIWQTQMNGGNTRGIASGNGTVTNLAIDGSSVYWADGASVNKVALGGGTVAPLATVTSKPTWIGIDSTYVYWVTGAASLSKTTILTGGATTPIISGQTFSAVASDGTSLYWEASSTLEKMPLSGGTPVTLAHAVQGALVVAGNSVAWVQGSSTALKLTPK